VGGTRRIIIIPILNRSAVEQATAVYLLHFLSLAFSQRERSGSILYLDQPKLRPNRKAICVLPACRLRSAWTYRSNMGDGMHLAIRLPALFVLEVAMNGGIHYPAP
jgi:hypothetical protein